MQKTNKNKHKLIIFNLLVAKFNVENSIFFFKQKLIILVKK